MDQKTWLWRKRGSEKTIAITSADEVQSPHNEKEVGPSEKELELESSLRDLNDKLASVMDECSAKDELLLNCEKMAEDALSAEKQRSEEEIQSLKRKLDEELQQKAAANERLGHLNSALKDSMQQLNVVRQEQDQRVQDIVAKATDETSKKLESVTVENSYLSKAILVKDRMIEDLKHCKGQTDAEFEALMTRLDKVEKENAFLRYEVRTFEKELDLRNEELEYGRRSAEAAQRQHLEGVKKIKKLESECQRLRTLNRKRLPNSAMFTNMRSTLEFTEQRNRTDFRRRKDMSGNSVDRNSSMERSFFIDHVRDLEKENEILKECLVKKEEQILCLKKVEDSASETHVSNTAPDELSLTSGYGIGDSNEIVCSRSWASEMSLMDDFVEMEKLAIVAIENHTPTDSEKKTRSVTKDLVPVEHKAEDLCVKKPDDWLANVATIILEQHGISKRSIDELLGDVRMVLNSVTCPETSDSQPISGYITWTSPNSPPISSLVKEHSMVREAFKKHLGGDGPGTALELEAVQNLMSEMEEICSVFQLEVDGVKNELSTIKSSAKDVDASLHSVKEDNEDLRQKLQESRLSVESLQNELEFLKESKRVADEQVENQKLMNEDLDTQLSITTVKLNEAVQKLSSIEVQLDDRSHCCEELEGTCLDLQLQLESIRTNKYSDSEGDEKQQELLQTGMEITKASVKLEECEQTILKLGRQLKALGSTKELAVVEKVLSITEANNKSLSKRLSLHDMLSEDGAEVEAISKTETNAPPRAYLGQTPGSRSFKAGALVIVPSKQKGGMSFLRKLLLRKKKTSTKNASFYYGK